MEVEPPPAAAVLKCLGVGGGGDPVLEAIGGRASRSPAREAAAEPPQDPADDGTAPATSRSRAEEEPLRRGLAAARARRKAGRATPSPSWKLEASPPRAEAEEAAAAADAGRRGGAPAASARQLGATLWEIQDVIRVASAGRRIRRRGRMSPNGDEAVADADRACIQELMQERQQYHHDIDSLTRQVTEDKMARRNKEQEKMKASLCSLQEELEDEKHLRKHSETLHRKLGKELSEMKSAFVKAVKDLEREKKVNCLLEDLCDEFAKGIKNYEEEVRVLRQKRVKEYGHKFDKSIVHFSEAWLDERMQMQNADMRNDSAGKIPITERLSSEIQSFLHRAKTSGNSKNDNLHAVNEKRDASLCRQSLESVPLNGATSAPRLAEDDDGSSVASDLHCFELNMRSSAIRNHELAGTRRRLTSCMHSPMRRLEYSNGVSIEGSPMSNAPPSSKKDKTRSSIGRQQFIASTPEIDSHYDAAITPIEEQNETVMTQVSRRLRDDLLKIKIEAPQHAYLGQKSNYARTNQLCEYTTSRDLHDMHGPAHQLNNEGKLLDYEEISESPAHHQMQGTKENTLKAKLLQARLEGQHARMSASREIGKKFCHLTELSWRWKFRHIRDYKMSKPGEGDHASASKGSSLNTGMAFNYADVANIHGSESGRLPYFEGKDFSWYKHRMKMYLMSIGPPIWEIVEKGFILEDKDNPTTSDQLSKHRNTQAVSAILSSLNPKEYSRVTGIENARKMWKKLICSHEGVDVVKKLRLQVLKNQFNFFVMNKVEESQQTHDRLINIVNERRSYGDNIKDEEVNYKLLMALRMWNPTLCTIIEEKDGFEGFTMNEVIGRINAHKSLDDEGKRVNNGFTKRSFDKAKARRTSRRCYEYHEQGHMIVECPKLNDKGKKNEKYNNKSKSYKKPYIKEQAHIGQEYISDDDDKDNESGIANIAIGLPPAKKPLFNNLTDDEDDTPRCFMAKESKAAPLTDFNPSYCSDEEEDLVPSMHEMVKMLNKLQGELDNQERIVDRQEELLDEEKSKNLELTKQLEQEKEKNKTLTKELAKVNESSESSTSTSKKYQERCNILQEENKALAKAIEDLKVKSRSLLNKVESSQASTSKGCERCHNIDVDMIAK
ncbi:hypothetical protein PR202_gb22976 [Eleusine coracana subsp. coracana]|uniref:Uncharacterized protein n=1 Tax=Eleusine coracana subsp. coracana TaxID=191504 RepID=A0AAV5FHN8_ELECO|nr:hypothetical protein PR202_gb22976 [Eleusine coracana subsp. coracana]